jgi:hypothetical protein
VGFDEPYPSPERSSPTRLSTSGHAKYKTEIVYEGVSRNSRTESTAKYTTRNKRVWKIPTSTQLRETWHTDFNRHGRPTIYRCFALPQLLYKWRHHSGIFLDEPKYTGFTWFSQLSNAMEQNHSLEANRSSASMGTLVLSLEGKAAETLSWPLTSI